MHERVLFLFPMNLILPLDSLQGLFLMITSIALLGLAHSTFTCPVLIERFRVHCSPGTIQGTFHSALMLRLLTRQVQAFLSDQWNDHSFLLIH